MFDKTYSDPTFAEALKKEQEYRLSMFNPRMAWRKVSGHMYYDGPEIPFTGIYFRWLPDSVVLATIETQAPEFKGGRLPVIFDALEEIYDDIQVESVLNPHMRAWLERRGYEVSPTPGLEEDSECGHMRKPMAVSPAPGPGLGI